jgi:hypothetical protein
MMVDHAHIKTKCGNLDVTIVHGMGIFMSYEQIAQTIECTVDDVEIDMHMMWGSGVSQFTVMTQEPMVSLPVVIEYLASKLGEYQTERNSSDRLCKHNSDSPHHGVC